MTNYVPVIKSGLPHLFDNLQPESQYYGPPMSNSRHVANPSIGSQDLFIPINDGRTPFNDPARPISPEDTDNMLTLSLKHPSNIQNEIFGPTGPNFSGRQETETCFGPEKKPNAVVDRKPDRPGLFQRFMMKAQLREFIPDHCRY